MKNKEAIYDAEISPMMAKIIEICKREGICMLASFDIGHDDDPDLNCLTVTADENGDVSDHHVRARHAIRGGGGSVMTITTHRADGSAISEAVIGE